MSHKAESITRKASHPNLLRSVLFGGSPPKKGKYMPGIHEHAKKIERKVRLERLLKGLLSKILVCIWVGVLIASAVGYNYLLSHSPKIASVIILPGAVMITIFIMIGMEILRLLRNK